MLECLTSLFIILGVSGLFFSFLFYFGWKILLANNVGPDLGLHCLPIYQFQGINGLSLDHVLVLGGNCR